MQGLKRCQQIGLLVAVMVASALVTGPVAAQGAAGKSVTASEAPSPPNPMVIKGAEHVATVTPYVTGRALRDSPKAKAWQPGDPVREIPRRVYPRSRTKGTLPPPIAPRRDPLLDGQESTPEVEADRVFTTPGLNFEGIAFTGAFPPDTVGEVGPNHYVQMVNGGAGALVTMYDKSGILLLGPVAISSIASGNCANGRGDPIVLYDRLADRWLLSEFSGAANALCVYVSTSPDPTTTYSIYEFPIAQFPDYPKYAVWPDAYYVSTNESSPAVYALERDKMLNGLAANLQRFTAPSLAGFGFQALIPSDLDGASAPPAGAPNYFMRHRDDEVHNPGANNPGLDFLEIWEFHVDFATPANSTFTGPINISMSEFDSDLCGLSSFFCFPQPGTTVTLDPLREVVMWRLQYRNFGTHESLVGNFVTDVSGTNQGGIRWFELRKTGAGSWTLFQEGTHAPDANHRWMGSIAMDKDGNIALAYSVSSTSVFPSIRYTGRLATDAPGTMTQGETTLIAGAASQTVAGITRWGDYSSMNVDPADDCTFWYTNEYVPASGLWQTRVGSFKFPSCKGPKDDVVIDFGDPNGLWKWMNDSTWDKLHSLSSEHLATGDVDGSGKDDVIVDFGPPNGLWKRMNDSTWVQLHSLSSEHLATGDVDGSGKDDVIVDFGPPNGLWKRMNDSTWVQLHSLSAEDLAVGDLDNLAPSAPNVPLAIPDSGTATSTLVVADNVTLTDVDVRVEINHTFVGDLKLTLKSPVGTEVVLLDRPGLPASPPFGCGDNNMDVTFDDASGVNLENLCSGSNVTPWFVGTAAPVESLAAFNGQSSQGTWSLIVDDLEGGDIGTIVDWELITTPSLSSTANGDDVIVDFGDPHGIWKWMNDSTWVKLHPLSSANLAVGDVDGNGKDDVIVDFGPPFGLWKWMNDSEFVPLHPLSAEDLATGDLDGNGKDDVIIDFGPGFGTWKWMNDDTFVLLHPLSSENLAVGDVDGSGKDDVIVDFGPAFGTWKWMNDSEFVPLHPLSTEGMVTGNVDGN